MIGNRRVRKETFFVYDQKDINRVLYNSPSNVDLIKEFIPLRKINKNHVGRCPFCRELTNNEKHFIVSEKGFKCFECGKGGTNIFGFLMIYFDKPFDKILNWVNIRYSKVDIKPIRIKGDPSLVDDLPF